jgi:hypothetical protein
LIAVTDATQTEWAERQKSEAARKAATGTSFNPQVRDFNPFVCHLKLRWRGRMTIEGRNVDACLPLVVDNSLGVNFRVSSNHAGI